MSRHRFDPVSFLFGTIFIIIALAALSNARVSGYKPEGLWSFTVVAVGVTLVVWAVASIARRSRARTADEQGPSTLDGSAGTGQARGAGEGSGAEPEPSDGDPVPR